MRWTLVAIAALMITPAHAEEARFPRAALVEKSIHQTGAEVKAFLGTLKKLEAEGAFDAGKGTDPRDDLGGLSPKNWLLAHVDAKFECRRDFGGVCESPDPRIRFAYVFLADVAWESVGTKGPDVYSPAGLSALSFSFRSVLGNIEFANGDGESCVPAIARTKPDLDTVMTRYLGPEGAGLEAYDNFIAVRGRYRVRAAPSVSAPVVGRIAHEVVFVPGPAETYSVHENDRNLEWTFVVPASGPAGFAALEKADILALSGVASPQVCVAVRDGRVMFTAHAGAGD